MKLSFALSLPHAEQLECFLHTSFAHRINLELSGALLDEPLPEKLTAVGIREIVPADLSRLIVGENLTVQLEFSRLFRKRCRRAAQLGARYIGADFDLPGILRVPERANAAAQLLPELLGIAAREHLELRLQLRLPPADVLNFADLIAFSRQFMLPNIGFAWDFHPHEPGAFDRLDIRDFHFSTGNWRINFEPEKGNRLTSALWEKFSAILTTSPFTSAEVAISPGLALPDELLLRETFSALPPWEA